MNSIPYYIDFFKFTLETAFACFCFTGRMEKCPHFYRRCLVMISAIGLLVIPVSALARYFMLSDYGFGTAVTYSLLSVMAFSFIFCCYRDSVWNLLFCCISGAMIRMCAKKIFDIFLIALRFSNIDIRLFAKGRFERYIVYYLIFLSLFLAIHFCFRNIFYKGHLLTLNGKQFSVYIVILGINLILNNLEPVLLEINAKYYALLVFCEMTYYILILCMQSFLFQMAQAKLEAHDLQELWRQDRQQYELMKENIEIINIMCHDLRHQLHSIGKQTQLPPQFIEEMEHSISVYDSKFQTGNQTLDVILTDKHLRCDAERIQFTCIADGEKLNFIEHSDLISLFGNALENALEYEVTVPNPGDRFINLLVRQKNDFLIINVENYFEGELQMKDGFPVTQKQDKTLHGYGLKSIQRIVRKYEGNVHISKEGNTFLLNILIPLPKST